MLDLSTPHPLPDIVASVSAKTPLGSAMRTAEWETVPAGLRDAAFFSASVESTRWLQRAQDGITDIIGKARATNERGESYWKQDRSRLLADLRRFGEDIALQRPGGRDGKIREADITDPLSIARLRLIIETQIELAYGKADWLTSMDPDILAAFPAWELVRISGRRVPRDWPARWKAAGGKFSTGGRMIALKSDPIWKALSRFGNPHPPFDFNSGMGVEDIDREEAEDLGIIGPDDVQPSNVAAHQEELKASLKGLQAPLIERLKKQLGPRAEVRQIPQPGQSRQSGQTSPEIILPLNVIPLPKIPQTPEIKQLLPRLVTDSDPLPEVLIKLIAQELRAEVKTLAELKALPGGPEWWQQLIAANA